MHVEGLTAREREVLALLAAGWSNVAIADHLGCSRRTVETHVEHILDKLVVPRGAEVNRRVFAARLYLAQPRRLRASTDGARPVPS